MVDEAWTVDDVKMALRGLPVHHASAGVDANGCYVVLRFSDAIGDQQVVFRHGWLDAFRTAAEVCTEREAEDKERAIKRLANAMLRCVANGHTIDMPNVLMHGAEQSDIDRHTEAATRLAAEKAARIAQRPIKVEW